MAILVDKNTRVVVQGLTGREGHIPCESQRRLRNPNRRRSDAG